MGTKYFLSPFGNDKVTMKGTESLHDKHMEKDS